MQARARLSHSVFLAFLGTPRTGHQESEALVDQMQRNARWRTLQMPLQVQSALETLRLPLARAPDPLLLLVYAFPLPFALCVAASQVCTSISLRPGFLAALMSDLSFAL